MCYWKPQAQSRIAKMSAVIWLAWASSTLPQVVSHSSSVDRPHTINNNPKAGDPDQLGTGGDAIDWETEGITSTIDIVVYQVEDVCLDEFR